MRITVFVDCPSAIVITERLLDAGVPISEVVSLGPDAAKALGHLPNTSAVSRRSFLDVSDLRADPIRIRTDLAVLVLLGAPDLADGVETRVAVHVYTPERSTALWDPLGEAILSGSSNLPVVTRLVAHGRTIREDKRDLSLAGNSSDVATDFAASVATFVNKELAGSPQWPTSHSLSMVGFGPTVSRLNWPESWDQVDWDRPAKVLQQVVRAAVLPGRGAWTWFAGARLGISAAVAIDSVVAGVPAGTVIGHADEGLIVQAGNGVLRIHNLRDLLGPVDSCQVPVGTRLGRDTLTELADLTRRVQDLERLVLVMAGDTDLLAL